MARVRLIARKPFVYNGRQVAQGEVFEVSPIEAAALTYQHRAMFFDKAPTPTVTEREPRRVYRRRDMVAEG